MIDGRSGCQCAMIEPPDVLRALHDYRPDNLLVSVIGPDAPTDAVVPQVKVRYQRTRLPQVWLSRWQTPSPRTAMILPLLSPFDPGKQVPTPLRRYPRRRRQR